MVGQKWYEMWHVVRLVEVIDQNNASVSSHADDQRNCAVYTVSHLVVLFYLVNEFEP